MEIGGNLEQHFDQLFDKISALCKECKYASANRVTTEVRRLAKAESQVIPYLRGTFHVMNDNMDLLQPETAKEAAIEAIALLDRDHAMAMQPDVDEQMFELYVHWMLPCSYDNLAKATAQMEGYNSPGMHGCISEGIDVCHRVGKLECVACFREYATGVYQAADDHEMAMHYARGNSNPAKPSKRQDRRYVGASDVGDLLLERGQLEPAFESYQQAMELSEHFHNPFRAALFTSLDMALCLRLLGAEVPEDMTTRKLDVGELPSYDLTHDRYLARCATIDGDHARARELLTPWDRRLDESKCLSRWMSLRLQMVGATVLAGDRALAERLAQPLERRAKGAHDWLTLRLLKRTLDPGETIAPIATTAPMSAGPYAPKVQAAVPESVPAPAAEAAPAPADDETPDGPVVQEVHQALSQENLTVDDAFAIYERIVTADELSGPGDALNLLSIGAQLHDQLPVDGEPEEDGSPSAEQLAIYHGRGRRLWERAQVWAERYAGDAGVVGFAGEIGRMMRGEPGDVKVDPEIDEDRVAALLRQALDMDNEHVANHAYAARFFLARNMIGEAERVLARGFRLARDESYFALRLAAVYRETDRTRDALAVLDLCLREGGPNAEVLWDAMGCARVLDQHQLTITYLEAYEEVTREEPQALVHYYKARALTELGRYDEAEASLDEEHRRYEVGLLERKAQVALFEIQFAAHQAGEPIPEALPPGTEVDPLTDQERDEGCWHLLMTRALLAWERDADDRAAILERALAVPMSAVGYMTPDAQFKIATRLWTSLASREERPPERDALERWLFGTGLVPDELLQEERMQNEAVEDLRVYRCLMRQPLDERWRESPYCLAGQEEYDHFYVIWTVAALSEEAAREMALAAQARCGLPGGEPEIEGVMASDETYNDAPGLVGLGERLTKDE